MTESEIQKPILEYLKQLEKLGKLMFIRNNTGRVRVGRRYINFGKTGSPDIFVFIPKWDSKGDIFVRTIGFEVKTEENDQSDGQIAWEKAFKKLGGKYYVVRSLDEVRRYLNEGSGFYTNVF